QAPAVPLPARRERKASASARGKTTAIAIPKSVPTGLRQQITGDFKDAETLPKGAATILLVEDMAEIALIAQKLARRAGYNIDWVGSAEAGWDYLQQHRPAPALLDIHLP